MELHFKHTLLILSLPPVQLTAHFSLEDETVWAGKPISIKSKVKENMHNSEILMNKKHSIHRSS